MRAFVMSIDVRKTKRLAIALGTLVVTAALPYLVERAERYGYGRAPASGGLATAPPLPARAIYRGNPDDPHVALAVNVDWGQEVLPAMLGTLAERDVKVTFFVTGRWASKFPEVVKELAARGHEVANHGLDHSHPLALSDEQLRALVVDNAALLEELTGRRPVLFAPPYGEVDERVVRIAAESRHYTIMWTVDTIDWQRPAPSVIVQRVERQVGPGAIILMHPTEPTVQALPEIIALLRRRGLSPTTVGRIVAGLQRRP